MAATLVAPPSNRRNIQSPSTQIQFSRSPLRHQNRTAAKNVRPGTHAYWDRLHFTPELATSRLHPSATESAADLPDPGALCGVGGALCGRDSRGPTPCGTVVALAIPRPLLSPCATYRPSHAAARQTGCSHLFTCALHPPIPGICRGIRGRSTARRWEAGTRRSSAHRSASTALGRYPSRYRLKISGSFSLVLPNAPGVDLSDPGRSKKPPQTRSERFSGHSATLFRGLATGGTVWCLGGASFPLILRLLCSTVP